MKDENQDLKHAYDARRQHSKAPSRIKREVMRQALNEEHSPSIAHIYKTWGPLASAALVLLVVVGLVQFDRNFSNMPNQHTALISVELHGFSESKKDEITSEYAVRKEHYFNAYQQATRSAQVATRRIATVQRAGENTGENENLWVLKDCNDTLIQLSEQLVAQLQKEARLHSGVAVGSQVELALSSEGLILFIESGEDTMC